MKLNRTSALIATNVCVVCLIAAPTLATATQHAEHTNPVTSRFAIREKVSEAKTSPDKPAPAASASLTKTAGKKMRAGNRFWARIMANFRDVHSAEKKQKVN